MNLGNEVDQLLSLEAEAKAMEKDLAALKKVIESRKGALLELMDTQNLGSAGGRLGVIKVQETTVPSVQDWDKFYEYIKSNDYFHLLQRRPSSTGCRELFERNGSIPGVVPFVKRELKKV